MRLSPFDLAIIVLYVVGITLFGMRFRGGQRTIHDYFLGGRAAPWWAIALSIVATETSLLTVISTPALAFGGNFNFLQLVMGYVAGRVLICFLFIPQYFRGEFYTAYQLIEKRFGEHMRRIAAGTFLLTRTLAEGVRVAAITKVVSVAFGLEARFAVLPIAALTLLYTFEGGMTAVIWTDVIQLFVYLSGAGVALFLLLQKIPGGWAEAAQAAAAGGKFSIFDFTFSLTRTYTFWSGIFGGIFLTLASHGTDQLIVQRLLAARSERDSKRALLASGLIVFVQFSLFLFLGVLLYAYHQHVPLVAPGGDYDKVFPEFVVREMPGGLKGLLIAAIFAAAMANLSGALNSLASSTIVDFARLRRQIPDPARTLALSRSITVAWGIVLMLLGLLPWKGLVIEKGLTVASVIYQSLLGLFLLGILHRRASARGALAGMFAGLALMIYVVFWTPLAWTWYVLVGTAATFAVGVLVSAFDSGAQPGATSPSLM